MKKEYDFSDSKKNPYGSWQDLPDPSVDNYARYRPNYPPEILSLLYQQYGFAPSHTVADIGSGTGNLSRIFLEAKHSVFGVEPSKNFRLAAAHLLSRFPNYTSIEGSAEKTTLSDSSVDLISVGQALHWFDIPRSHIEFRRILKPRCPVVLAWNFAVPDSPYFSEYKKFLRKHGLPGEFQSNDAEVIHQELITSFFADGFSRHKFHHDQKLDWEGFVGLKLSGSEIPVAGEPGHKEALDDLRSFFDSLQKSGEVSIPYEARVYVGFLPR